MTEQEQLREMGQIICGRCLDGVCLIDKCVCEGVCEQITAKELYNADYRKADEVRKETAKDICLKIIEDIPKSIKEKWIKWFNENYNVEYKE